MSEYKCEISGKVIPPARVEALRSLGVPEQHWTCVEYSQTRHRKGIYLGEVGTSRLLIVDKVYDDSVRSVFRGAHREAAQSNHEAEDSDFLKDEDCDSGGSVDEPGYLGSFGEDDPAEKVEIVKRHDS